MDGYDDADYARDVRGNTISLGRLRRLRDVLDRVIMYYERIQDLRLWTLAKPLPSFVGSEMFEEETWFLDLERRLGDLVKEAEIKAKAELEESATAIRSNKRRKRR